MKKNNSGFSIMVGMGLTLLISLSAYVILSFIIPFSKSVRGVENSSISYYLSYAGIEEAMYFLKTRTALNSDSGSLMSTNSTGFSYNTYSTGDTIPKPLKGDSPYDNNYNTISMATPIQLQVGNGYIAKFDQVKFSFRVPDIDNDLQANDETLSGGTLPIIYWSLSSGNGSDVLYASGSYITAGEISKANCSSYCDWTIYDKNGINLDGTPSDFESYFENNCGIASGCVLKLSIINDLELTTGAKIPFLEYKITGLGSNFPDRFTSIKSSGKAYGYQKDLEISVPQETVNQAFDFTVFQ